MWCSSLLLIAGLLSGGWWGALSASSSPSAAAASSSSILAPYGLLRSSPDWSRTNGERPTTGRMIIFGPSPREEHFLRNRAYDDSGGGGGGEEEEEEENSVVDGQQSAWLARLRLQSRLMEVRERRSRLRHRGHVEIPRLPPMLAGFQSLRRDAKEPEDELNDDEVEEDDVDEEEEEEESSEELEAQEDTSGGPAEIGLPGDSRQPGYSAPQQQLLAHYANESTTRGLEAPVDPRWPLLEPRSRVTRSLGKPQQQPQQPSQQSKQQQRGRNRTRSDSPREQRRRCRARNNCRGRNWCPDMDVGNRAYLAPTVFEGKARSMSSLRKPGSNYAVTFEVRQVYKSQPGFLPLQKNDSVRLHFRDKTVPGKSTICGNGGQDQQQQQNQGARSYQQQQQKDRDNLSANGVVRANIKRGKVYLVFVNRVGPRNFTILGEPVIRSKKNEQAVQAVIRPDYVREVTLSELRDSVARYRDRVKLVCRTRGSPPPRVHWLKNGVPLQPRRGLRIQHKRRRSKVVISSARLEDSGKYECVAESTSGHRASLTAQLLVAHDTRIPETTTAWLRQEQPCPIEGDFCMNGGTCLFFETVGEPACRCAEGFTGLRCETKDVISTGNMDKFSSFTEDLALARF